MANQALAKKPLQEIIREMPDLELEVEDFANFLWSRRCEQTQPKKRKIITFGWAGALKDLRDKYTSVELQHEISNMIAESAMKGVSPRRKHSVRNFSGPGKGLRGQGIHKTHTPK